jgi:hypothetical protein
MRSNRLVDFLIVATIVACGAYYVTRGQATPPVTPTPVTVVPSTGGFPDKAVPFQLHRIDGSTLDYAGKGPLIVTLTAIACQGCRERIPLDKELLAMAKSQKIPLYNVLVFGDDTTGPEFAKQYQPEADEILVDPGGRVFVDQYRGSDNNCWMLIGPQGEFRYRGPANMIPMKTALAELSAQGF